MKEEARAAEAAAIRRRWITLGEVVAVLAVVISGLTLWNSWSERSDADAARQAEARQEGSRAATLVLVATREGGRELALKPVAGGQQVQSQTITFPTALGLDPAQTTGEPRIEAAWFERALARAREAAGRPDGSRGDERLPVLIATQFLADGHMHHDVAIYDVGYTIAGRLLSGHSVTLRGLSLAAHVVPAKAGAALDARWAKLMPARR